jgi:RNA polymerase sigma-70 factor (ECF subfamily)
VKRETAPKEGKDDPSLWLIEQIQAGIEPEENLRRLHERHYRRVVSFFLRKGVSPEESRDLTQEVFLRAFKGIDGFRKGGRFESWLFEIAHNVFSNEVRRRHSEKRKGREASLDTVREDDHSSAAAIDEERLQTLRRALAELPPPMRLCCELRYVRGYSYQEIATLTKISIETVRAHLHQARRRLEDRLADAEDKGEH